MVVVEGVVIEGRQLGRQLGFPTANIEIKWGSEDEIRRGVYHSRVWIDGVCYWAATNVGVNPTVGELPPSVESHIFDFDGDIYGQTIRVELIEWLRSEVRFGSLDELKAQIARDVARCREAQQGDLL